MVGPSGAVARVRLLGALAEAAGCDGRADCPEATCLCQAQARAVLDLFWLRPRAAAVAVAGGRKPWTAEGEVALREAWARSPPQSLEDIAAALGRSRWSVKAKARALRLRRRDWGPGQPRRA